MRRFLIIALVVPALTLMAFSSSELGYFVTDDCVGCGACWINCPHSFAEGDDGKATTLETGFASEVKEAQSNCPVSAIWSNF